MSWGSPFPPQLCIRATTRKGPNLKYVYFFSVLRPSWRRSRHIYIERPTRLLCRCFGHGLVQYHPFKVRSGHIEISNLDDILKDSRYLLSRAQTLCPLRSFGGIVPLPGQRSFHSPVTYFHILIFRLGSFCYRSDILLWIHPMYEKYNRHKGTESQVSLAQALLKKTVWRQRNETRWNYYCNAAKIIYGTRFRMGRHTDSMERWDEIVYRDTCLIGSFKLLLEVAEVHWSQLSSRSRLAEWDCPLLWTPASDSKFGVLLARWARLRHVQLQPGCVIQIFSSSRARSSAVLWPPVPCRWRTCLHINSKFKCMYICTCFVKIQRFSFHERNELMHALEQYFRNYAQSELGWCTNAP